MKAHNPPFVLVVEDDEATRYLLSRLLQSEGYQVATAENGQLGLDYLHSHHLPQLILLDLKMPVVNGWEFRRAQLRNPAFASIPVVILSDSSEAEAEENQLGEVGYLQKPVLKEKLLPFLQRFAREEKQDILVVEDEPGVLRFMEVALRHIGFRVRAARNGEEAVQLYAQHADNIALVLLDVQMPGLDGPGTLTQLRARNPQVRCCFMSGDTGIYTVDDLLRMGAVRVLAKPFRSLVQLMHDLENAITDIPA
jgi:CheY-like chemotaxis protein